MASGAVPELLTAAPGGRRRAASPAIAGSLVTFAATVAAGALLARRYTRYCVRGVSMEPAFHDGDFLVVDRAAYRRGAPKAGHVVIATDPREPTRTVVKRAAEVTALDVTLLGDNPDHSTDSRTYGPVPYEAVLGRVVWRYWPLRRSSSSMLSSSRVGPNFTTTDSSAGRSARPSISTSDSSSARLM